jgi:DNA end-binding protein Ku
MARSIWTGYITFGLVSVPVGLYTATQEHEVDFHQFQRGTSDRIRYKRVNERTGREVDYDKIVKGHEVGNGQYVMVEPDELDDVAPGRSRSLEISTFVDLAEVDPIHFQKSYYLAPSDEQNTSSYALLREALAKTNRAGIASFVMRGKEYLAAIRADAKVLVLETMFFADEIRDPADELGTLPAKSRDRKQVAMAVDVIEAMSGPWKPDEYHDSYTERVRDLIDAKRRGKEITVTETEPEATDVTDLVSALRASLEDARSRRRPGSKTRKKAATKRRGTATDAAKLAEAPKAELEDLARELNIRGRSSMNRRELADAIAKAQRSRAA